MADSVDNIRIRAELEGALARDAHIAGDEVERLGDKALEAAAKLEVLDKANKDAASSSGGVASKTEKVGDAASAAAKDVEELAQSSEHAAAAGQRAAKSHRAQHKGLDALNRVMALGQKIGRKANPLSWFTRDADKNSKAGGRFTKVLKKIVSFIPRLAMFGLIASGLSFLATALNGVGAAGIAAVSGLAPLTGMLIAYPGLIGAVVQGMAAFKIGTAGMGELLKTTLDPEATAEALKKARKNMAQSQLDFAQAVKSRKSAFMDMRKSVGGTLFAGLDDEVKGLADTYLPILNKQLGTSAFVMNQMARNSSAWLRSSKGVKTMNSVMGTNNRLIGSMGLGLGHVLQTVLYLVDAAGPMLGRMGEDFAGWTAGLAKKADQNQKPLERFFDRSYDLFKHSGKVLGTYMRGLYNIGRESGSLSKYIGTSIESIGKRFEAWTSSKKGKASIRQYFDDMKPVVRELGLWIRDIGRLLRDGQMDPKQFTETSKSLRENLLPAIAKAIGFANATVVPALMVVLDVIGNLSEAGLIGGATAVLKPFGKAIVWLSEKLASAPDPAKKAMALAAAVGTLYGIFRGKGIIGGLLSKTLGGGGRAVRVTNRVLRVFVTNKGGIFGGKDKRRRPVGDPSSDRNKPRTGRSRTAAEDEARAARAAERAGRHRAAPTSRVGKAVERIKESRVGEAARATGSAVKNSKVGGAAGAAGKFLGITGALIGLYGASKDVGKSASSLFGWDRAATKAASGSSDFNKRYKALADNIKGSDVGKHAKELGIDTDRLAKSMAASGKKGKYYQEVMEKAKKSTSGFGGVMRSLWPGSQTKKWGAAARDLKNIGNAIGNTSSKAEGAAKGGIKNLLLQTTKYGGALRTLPSGVQTKISAPGYKPTVQGIIALTRQYNLTPKQVRTLITQTGGKPTKAAIDAVIRRAAALPRRLSTAISAPGFKATYGSISRLAEKYRLTPRQVRTLVRESGASLTRGQMQKVIDKARETGRQKPRVKVDADTSRAQGALSSILSRISNATAYVKVGMQKVGSWIGGVFSYAGNPVPHAGFKSYVGELAPEAFMDRSGRMEMIGKHGPELRTFNRPGAIIPHTALADPMKGATGNTPQWAIDKLREKTLAARAPQPAEARGPAPRAAGAGGSSGGDVYDIDVAVDARGSNLTEAQVEAAAKKGTEKALREAKRRKIDHGWDRDL